MLEVFAHADLVHQFVLVSVHAGQLTHVREYVLQAVSQLERVHVTQSATQKSRALSEENLPITKPNLSFLQVTYSSFCRAEGKAPESCAGKCLV